MGGKFRGREKMGREKGGGEKMRTGGEKVKVAFHSCVNNRGKGGIIGHQKKFFLISIHFKSTHHKRLVTVLFLKGCNSLHKNACLGEKF